MATEYINPNRKPVSVDCGPSCRKRVVVAPLGTKGNNDSVGSITLDERYAATFVKTGMLAARKDGDVVPNEKTFDATTVADEGRAIRALRKA